MIGRRAAGRAALVRAAQIAAAVLLPAVASAAAGPVGVPVAPVVRLDGVPCVAAGDLARLLDGVQYWRNDTRKLVIRSQGHRLTLTEGVPIALLDDRTLRLDAPVRSLGGELQVPLSLLPELPRDSASVRLVVDATGTRVRASPAGGWVGAPRITVADDATLVTVVAASAARARITSRDRTHFRIWLPGAPGGAPRDTLPAGSLVRALRRLPAAEGVTWELDLAPAARSWKLLSPPGQDAVVLRVSDAAGGWAFAAEGPTGERALRVVVLDPGHGGEDAGVRVAGAIEKDLALQLARQIASELERRAGSHVLLTRDNDRALAQPERAEIANRARADLVLSLHFDGARGMSAHGATAWCPSITDRAGEDAGAQELVPWRDVAGRWAGASRALADAVTASLQSHGQGPARVRERMPVALLGVNAPGISLECATLTSSDDLARLTSPDGLHALAAAIADGLIAWSRHEEVLP